MIDATSVTYTPGFYDLEGIPEALPGKYTLRFRVPQDAPYSTDDKLRAGARVWDVATVAEPGEAAPDGLWGGGALVTLDVEGSTAFFKAGGTSWNIFFGEEPPDKPDGLFVEIDTKPTKVVFNKQRR